MNDNVLAIITLLSPVLAGMVILPIIEYLERKKII